MPVCNECGEPAAKRFVMGLQEKTRSDLCYRHAAEDGLMDLPADAIDHVAIENGYAFNGVAFILESLCRGETLESAKDVSLSVLREARRRFGSHAKEVFCTWNIRRNADIGAIAFKLAEQQLVRVAEGISLKDFNEKFSLIDMLDLT